MAPLRRRPATGTDGDDRGGAEQRGIRMRSAAIALGTVLLAATLAGCGGSRTEQAVDTCSAAIAERLADKNYRLDRETLVRDAAAEGDDVIRVRGPIVFDPGMPREYTQTIDCRARFADDGVDVIALNFIW